MDCHGCEPRDGHCYVTAAGCLVDSGWSSFVVDRCYRAFRKSCLGGFVRLVGSFVLGYVLHYCCPAATNDLASTVITHQAVYRMLAVGSLLNWFDSFVRHLFVT